MKIQHVVTEKGPRGDLSDSIRQVLDKNGEHVVYEDDDGRKLIAHVSDGIVVQWSAFDRDQSEVATVVIRQPSQNPPGEGATNEQALRRARWAIVCACYESGDFCWWQPY